ncbi:MAG: mevalonate kinase [archaeon]
MSVVGKGYAKVILFGEHFVVYGLPGIASALDKFVQVEVQKVKDSDDVVFDDKVFKEKVSMKENSEHIKCKLFNAMFKEEEFVQKKGIKFMINSTFSPGGGMGYSAALNVGIARAMNNLFELGWKDEKINEVGYKGECISHGAPSGIDNTCATYGSLVWFEKNMEGGKNKIKPFKTGKPLLLVIVDTGIKHDTKEAVAGVKKRKEENPEEYKKIFSEAKKIVAKAKKELSYGGIQEIGKLMNQNQELLKKIGVSSPEIEQIIKISLYEGALGAKLTGAGCGGNVLVLCENEAQQNKIIVSLQTKGFRAIKAKIN